MQVPVLQKKSPLFSVKICFFNGNGVYYHFDKGVVSKRQTGEKKEMNEEEIKDQKHCPEPTEEVTDKMPEAENAPETEKKTEPDPAAELAAMQEKFLYLQAEYQNYRKRMAKEIADARRYAVEETLHPFLTVFDFLAMAENAADQSDNIESIRQGLKMIIAEYRKAFDELGLRPFNAAGEKFNPELHDAVAHENSDEVEEGVVSKQWNCGFKLGDKVIRAARVVVSAGKKNEAPETPKAPEEK